jgi:hypothetical protein
MPWNEKVVNDLLQKLNGKEIPPPQEITEGIVCLQLCDATNSTKWFVLPDDHAINVFTENYVLRAGASVFRVSIAPDWAKPGASLDLL